MHPKVAQANHLSLVSPVQLDKTDQVNGTIFRKQIMSYGRWVNPNWWWEDEIWMELTEEIADQFITNFNNKTFGKHISVPRNHTGDVNANAGEVIKLEKGTGGLWAYLDIRDPKTVEDIENGLIFDVSMGFDFDYVDQKEGLHHGATLIHVALVTDPYLNNMDDFQRSDTESLSRRFDQWAASFGFGKEPKSLIMMSKANVEELKRMKFAKVTNDKEHEVKVTYTGADGKEVTETVAAGAEIEVPTEAEEAVKTQIAEAAAPEDGDDNGDGDETPEEKEAREKKEADEKAAADAAAAGQGGEGEQKEGEESELSKALRENAQLKAEQQYNALLAKGKITPAQKELFMGLAHAGTVKLQADVKSMNLTKGQSTSVISMLSAILEAGPKMIKFGEKGNGKGEGKVELTKEQEDKIKRSGFNLDTFKKQLAKGTITLEDLDNE